MGPDGVVLGVLLIGFFGTASIGGVNRTFHGGGGTLLWNQAIAVGSVTLCSFVTSWPITQAIDKTIGSRINDEQEEEGMDTGLHAEIACELSTSSLGTGKLSND